MENKTKLEDRLAALNRQITAKKPEFSGLVSTGRALEKKQKTERFRKQPIEEFLDGHYVTNELGTSFHRTVVFPLDSFHGETPIRDGLTLEKPHIENLLGEGISGGREKLFFFDTETTGLAGGTGTVPFLLGIGYWTEESFVVEQFFMRDFDEEPSQLTAFIEKIKNFSDSGKGVLVTYNGKGFDFPLISTRFITNRMKNPMNSWPHLDLLFYTRRLWKKRLGDCSLGNIEKHILGVKRTGDIPGWLIPGVFFEFIREEIQKTPAGFSS